MWKISEGEFIKRPFQGSKGEEASQKFKKVKPTPKNRSKVEPPAEDDYDGYYYDRLPIDEGHRRDGLDKGIIKKVIALMLCLLVVIGACVAILYVL